ncbi:hypothetical protein D3C73_1468680 [compost metagenome]
MSIGVGYLLLGRLIGGRGDVGDDIEQVSEAMTVGYFAGKGIHERRVSHPRGTIGIQAERRKGSIRSDIRGT